MNKQIHPLVSTNTFTEASQVYNRLVDIRSTPFLRELMNRAPLFEKGAARRPENNHETTERLSNRSTSENGDNVETETCDTNDTFNGEGARNFPEILKAILSDSTNARAISWLAHGKAFLVLDRKLFVQEVLPKYLGKATKYTSFTRKLSRWNFSRVASGPDEGAWFNESFFRDDKVEKAREMKCAKRSKLSPSNEFRSSKPLKKRPVDASLFVADTLTMIPPLEKPEATGHEVFGGCSTLYGGRPLAIADTTSVVQAAMRALAHSQPRPDVPSMLRNSNVIYPLMNTRQTLEVLAALQANHRGPSTRS